MFDLMLKPLLRTIEKQQQENLELYRKFEHQCYLVSIMRQLSEDNAQLLEQCQITELSVADCPKTVRLPDITTVPNVS